MKWNNIVLPNEERVIKWLLDKNIDFTFNSQLYGGLLNDPKANFAIDRIILRTQEFMSSEEQIHKERLRGQGYTVIDLFPLNLIPERIDYTLNEALKGREIGY